MLEFLDIANEIVILLTSLLGLIGTGIGAYLAAKNWMKAIKEKTYKEHWELIMEMADAAMIEAEASKASGEEKKKIVLDSISAAAIAAGINIQDFIEQLNHYIDQTIVFVNKMKSKVD